MRYGHQNQASIIQLVVQEMLAQLICIDRFAGPTQGDPIVARFGVRRPPRQNRSNSTQFQHSE